MYSIGCLISDHRYLMHLISQYRSQYLIQVSDQCICHCIHHLFFNVFIFYDECQHCIVLIIELRQKSNIDSKIWPKNFGFSCLGLVGLIFKVIAKGLKKNQKFIGQSLLIIQSHSVCSSIYSLWPCRLCRCVTHKPSSRVEMQADLLQNVFG